MATETINEQMERLMLHVKNSANVMIEDLTNQISNLRGEGLTDKAIEDQLIIDYENGGAGWSNVSTRLNNSIEDVQERTYSRNLNRIILDDQVEETGLPKGKIKFFWNAIGANSCPSCTDRHGQINTMDVWIKTGLPQSRVLICKRRCKCILIPPKKGMKIYNAKNEKELTKKARKGINERLKEIKKLETKRGEQYARSTFTQKLGQWRLRGGGLDFRGRHIKGGGPEEGKIFRTRKKR